MLPLCRSPSRAEVFPPAYAQHRSVVQVTLLVLQVAGGLVGADTLGAAVAVGGGARRRIPAAVCRAFPCRTLRAGSATPGLEIPGRRGITATRWAL